MSKYKLLILTTLISLSLSLIIIFIFYLLAINNVINLIPSSNVWITPKVYPKEEKIIVEQKKVVKTDIVDLQNQVIDVINKVSPAVVNIIITKNLKIFIENPFDFYWWKVIEKKEKVWWGSGIGITSDGYIITNKHVVADLNADYSVVTRDGDIYKVSKIWFDPLFDLAVIKIVDENGDIPTNLKVAKIKSIKSPVKIGQFVIAIWNALAEYENSATFGIISAKGRILEDLPPTIRSLYIWLYQTDAAINPWNSWGPLIDLDWQVIWVNTAISAIGQGIWFAMPISKELVDATLLSIKKYWTIKRPFLWIMYTMLNKSIAKNKWLKFFQWAYIEKVLPGSAAYKAWLKVGDIILKIEDIPINIDNPLPFVLFTYLPGDEITLLVYKADEGKQREVKVILDEYK